MLDAASGQVISDMPMFLASLPTLMMCDPATICIAVAALMMRIIVVVILVMVIMIIVIIVIIGTCRQRLPLGCGCPWDADWQKGGWRRESWPSSAKPSSQMADLIGFGLW